MWLLDMLFGPPVASVSPEEAADLWKQGKAILVDVREARELAEASIPGAKHVPLSQLRRNVPDLPKDKVILCICRSGRRSIPAARQFLKRGYAEVYSVRGGLKEWQRLGLPVKPRRR